jgi:hypothetical protein
LIEINFPSAIPEGVFPRQGTDRHVKSGVAIQICLGEMNLHSAIDRLHSTNAVGHKPDT